MRKIAVITLALALITALMLQVQAGKQKPLIHVLYSSEQVFSDVFSVKDVTVQFFTDDQLFYVLSSDRQVSVYDSQYKHLRTVVTYMESPDSIAVDTQGLIYVADSSANQIRMFGSNGKVIRTFSVAQPLSLALLSDGTIVVGSGSNGALLHVYDSSGTELRSFGTIKQFVPDSESENRFLNRGKVVVDSFDTIYYVNQFAPSPTVQRFSRKGKLLSEFAILGDAVGLQLAVAQEFLKGRHPNKVGGIRIINSAAIDPGTNNIWVCMNGSSDSGVVYQYAPDGAKLREYSFLVSSRSNASKAIAGVNQMIVRATSICLFASDGAFRFDVNNRTRPGQIHPLEAATCPTAVEFGECKSPCSDPNISDDKDCKAELIASVNMNGRRIIETVCNTDATSCNAQIRLCKESNGAQTVHSINMVCGGTSGGGGEVGGGAPNCALINCNGILMEDPYFQACCVCPVLIDVSGNGFALTDAAGGVDFDLTSDGVTERLSWTAPNSDDAFLVLDRDGNGTIDDGTELFGNFTPNHRPQVAMASWPWLSTISQRKEGMTTIAWTDAIQSSLLFGCGRIRITTASPRQVSFTRYDS